MKMFRLCLPFKFVIGRCLVFGVGVGVGAGMNVICISSLMFLDDSFDFFLFHSLLSKTTVAAAADAAVVDDAVVDVVVDAAVDAVVDDDDDDDEGDDTSCYLRQIRWD